MRWFRRAKEPKRRYLEFDATQGYPAGDSVFFECLGCGGAVKSLPGDYSECSCGKVYIDVDYGRIGVKDHSMMRACVGHA